MRKFQIKAGTAYTLYRTSAYAVLLLCGANILPAAYSYARFAANPAAHGILMLPLLFFAVFALWRHGLNRKLYTALHAQTPLAKRWLSSEICLWLAALAVLLLTAYAQAFRLFGERLPLMD